MLEPRRHALVIVLCETRGWEVTWESFQTNVLRSLNADLALCVSDRERPDTPFHNAAKYVWQLAEPSDWAQLYTAQSGGDDWRQLLPLDDQLLGGVHDENFPARGSGAIIFYFRYFLGQCLMDRDLMKAYDWFILVRSDFVWTAPHPGLEHFSPDHLIVLDGEAYGGVSDRYAAIPAPLINTYLEITRPLIEAPLQLKAEITDAVDRGIVTRCNPEQFLKIRLTSLGLWDGIERIPYFGYSIRMSNGATRWQAGRFSSKHGYFIKYEREYAAAKVVERYIKISTDWNRILTPSSIDSRKLKAHISLAVNLVKIRSLTRRMLRL